VLALAAGAVSRAAAAVEGRASAPRALRTALAAPRWLRWVRAAAASKAATASSAGAAVGGAASAVPKAVYGLEDGAPPVWTLSRAARALLRAVAPLCDE